jgi:hypothetical protein
MLIRPSVAQSYSSYFIITFAPRFLNIYLNLSLRVYY